LERIFVDILNIPGSGNFISDDNPSYSVQ